MNCCNQFILFIIIFCNSWHSKIMIVFHKSNCVTGHIVDSAFEKYTQMNYFNIRFSEFLENEKSSKYYIIHISDYLSN